MKRKLKVAMIAPAWLTVPASGYGGIESMIDNLCRGLGELGARVELFTIKGSTAPADRQYWLYRDEQYKHLGRSMYDSAAIPMAHLLSSIDRIRQDGSFDVIHDHNHLLGPGLLCNCTDLPPVLHTLHLPFSGPGRTMAGQVDADPFFRLVGGGKKLYFNGISRSQLRGAPVRLLSKLMGVIYHGIDPEGRKFRAEKEDYFVNVGRISPEKGIDVAMQACLRQGSRFKMAGCVAGLNGPDEVEHEIKTPGSLSAHGDVLYYRDRIKPLLRAGQIEYTGMVTGDAKDELIGRAKAFLMPVQWEEPFGVAVIDALACGTPVVAMRRGSMPEIIEHGVNGFLADTPEEFRRYMNRVDEIDPRQCRYSVEERFSYQAMASQYLGVYKRIVAKHAAAPYTVLRSKIEPIVDRWAAAKRSGRTARSE